MITTSGRMWKSFITDKTFWPEGAYFEIHYVTINGREVNKDFNVQDVDVIRLRGGVVYLKVSNDRPLLLESYFRKWLKTQTHLDLVITIKREDVRKIRQLVVTAGAVIVGDQKDVFGEFKSD